MEKPETMNVFTYTHGQWWLAIMIGWVLLIGPGNIEGRYLPAAAPAKVLVTLPTSTVTPTPGTAVHDRQGQRTAFWLTSARLRPNCNFQALEWHLGAREGRSVPVDVEPGPPKVRPDGRFSAGPWTAGVSLRDFNRTWADVLHRCSVLGIALPWDTRTRFWN